MLNRPDLIYRYDGSFEGFLCCVFESFQRREIPMDIRPEGEGQMSLYPERYIDTNPQTADRVFVSVPLKISKAAAEFIADAFLSCMEQKELYLLRFLRLGYRYGAPVMNMLANDTVNALFKAVQFLKNESHYYKEFIRFSEIEGVLISMIEPKNFVLPLIREHFCSRFSGERFLIYDRTHRMMLAYQPFEAKLIPVDDFQMPEAEAEERHYRDLWQMYYHAIAIEGRYNPKCRMNHMPKRYWGCMTEFANQPQKARLKGAGPAVLGLGQESDKF